MLFDVLYVVTPFGFLGFEQDPFCDVKGREIVVEFGELVDYLVPLDSSNLARVHLFRLGLRSSACRKSGSGTVSVVFLVKDAEKERIPRHCRHFSRALDGFAYCIYYLLEFQSKIRSMTSVTIRRNSTIHNRSDFFNGMCKEVVVIIKRL